MAQSNPVSVGAFLTHAAMRSKAPAYASRRSFDFGSQNVTALRSSSCGGW